MSSSAKTGSKRLTVFLIRHAESQNNAVQVSHPKLARQLRHHDPDLSAKGVKQCERLREAARNSNSPEFQKMRAAASAGRLHFVCSPMRRALKTASFLADGLGFREAEVDPRVFEEGGCYHDFPEHEGMAGLAALEAMTADELAQLQAAPTCTLFPGLKEADVSDPAILSSKLGVSQGQAGFVSKVLPGMERGWFAGYSQREHRSGCFARARAFTRRVRRIAGSGQSDVLVAVIHADLLDMLLKCFIFHRGGEGSASASGIGSGVGDGSGDGSGDGDGDGETKIAVQQSSSVAPVADDEDRKLDELAHFVTRNTSITQLEIAREGCGVAHVLGVNAVPHLASSFDESKGAGDCVVTGGDVVADGWEGWEERW